MKDLKKKKVISIRMWSLKIQILNGPVMDVNVNSGNIHVCHGQCFGKGPHKKSLDSVQGGDFIW